jgi:hemerythrin-like domain-containing protein
MKTDVTRLMVEEHRLILRMIALVEEQAAAVERGAGRDWRFFLDAVDFIRNFADRYHHAKEEDVLFVALVDNGMPAKQSPIEAMHLEHEQGRAHVRVMEAAAQAALAGDTGRVAELVASARAYAALLRGHIDKEDQILYPLAERVLPAAVRPAMLQRYAEADARAAGLEERCRQLVEHYESARAAA